MLQIVISSDNILTGICTWVNESMGAHGDNIGEGIELTGSGNVICYNKLTGFRDCISTMEDQRTAEQTCIDIYNNDIYSGVDDAIEADFLLLKLQDLSQPYYKLLCRSQLSAGSRRTQLFLS